MTGILTKKRKTDTDILRKDHVMMEAEAELMYKPRSATITRNYQKLEEARKNLLEPSESVITQLKT
jgi:hypothetical protein